MTKGNQSNERYCQEYRVLKPPLDATETLKLFYLVFYLFLRARSGFLPVPMFYKLYYSLPSKIMSP